MKKALFSFLTHSVLTVTVLSASPSFASTVLSDNLSNGPDGTYTLLTGESEAQGFQTTAQGYTVTDVSMLLSKASPFVTGNFSVSIFDATGGGGKPGSFIGSVVSSYDASLLNYAASAVSWDNLSIVLTPDTSYYLVLTANNLQNGPARIGWVETATATGTGFPSDRALYTGGSWYGPQQNNPLQMKIDASGGTAVPEPSTYALLCLSLGVVGFARRRMMKNEKG